MCSTVKSKLLTRGGREVGITEACVSQNKETKGKNGKRKVKLSLHLY